MLIRDNLKTFVLEALVVHNGKAHLTQVAKHIWDNHLVEIQAATSLKYTWQYDMRWAATRLRKEGVLKPAESCDKGVWELV